MAMDVIGFTRDVFDGVVAMSGCECECRLLSAVPIQVAVLRDA